MRPRTVALLGSTGSIGTQALDVIRRNTNQFRVGALAAGANIDLLARQAVEFEVPVVAAVAAAKGSSERLRHAIAVRASDLGRGGYRPEVVTGSGSAATAGAIGADVVLNGITGSTGLSASLAAINAGSVLALANKESLIMGGHLIDRAAAPGQIVPVDSEHSAIAQSLRAGRAQEVRRLVLTASGGPFRGYTRAQLSRATPEQALVHPNFAMGRVITTNSATLVNKGLEVIEAHLLFGMAYDDIAVVIHPQQRVHAMVEFRDGSTIAQIGLPRMLVPIALALSWPERLDGVDQPCDWTLAQTWDFDVIDDETFPAVRLARQVGSTGGMLPAVYNVANEVAVEAFHARRIGFLRIVETIERVVHSYLEARLDSRFDGTSVEGVHDAAEWTRQQAESEVNR